MHPTIDQQQARIEQIESLALEYRRAIETYEHRLDTMSDDDDNPTALLSRSQIEFLLLNVRGMLAGKEDELAHARLMAEHMAQMDRLPSAPAMPFPAGVSEWAVCCDKCHAFLGWSGHRLLIKPGTLMEPDFAPTFPRQEQSKRFAEGHGWKVADGKHICPECR